MGAIPHTVDPLGKGATAETPNPDYTFFDWICLKSDALSTDTYPRNEMQLLPLLNGTQSWVVTLKMLAQPAQTCYGFIAGGASGQNDIRFVSPRLQSSYADGGYKYSYLDFSLDKITLICTPDFHVLGNGQPIYHTAYNGDFSPSHRLRSMYGFNTKYYDHKVWSDAAMTDDYLIHHYRPAVRNADAVMGMYDVIAETFTPATLQLQNYTSVGND